MLTDLTAFPVFVQILYIDSCCSFTVTDENSPLDCRCISTVLLKTNIPKKSGIQQSKEQNFAKVNENIYTLNCKVPAAMAVFLQFISKSRFPVCPNKFSKNQQIKIFLLNTVIHSLPDRVYGQCSVPSFLSSFLPSPSDYSDRYHISECF